MNNNMFTIIAVHDADVLFHHSVGPSNSCSNITKATVSAIGAVMIGVLVAVWLSSYQTSTDTSKFNRGELE